MSEVKDYGEPWEHDNGDVFNEDGKFVYSKVTGFVTQDAVSRTVACVNALAGLNPEKLAALIEAVEKYVEAHQKWEADIINDDRVWNTTDQLPHITQEIWDDVIPLQNMRNEVKQLLKELRGEK
jgi:hypothetical protein